MNIKIIIVSLFLLGCEKEEVAIVTQPVTECNCNERHEMKKEFLITNTIDTVDNGYDHLFLAESAKLVKVTSEVGVFYIIHTRAFGTDTWLEKYNGKTWKTLKGAERNFGKLKSSMQSMSRETLENL